LIPEFHYQIGWRAKGAHPGHHAGVQSGGGFEFHGHIPLIYHPDPRHLDVRATLADPFGELKVRTFRQRAAIPVYLLADLSASMGFQGQTRKTTLLATFAAAAAYSAYCTGDPFGFIACDSAIRWDLSLPLRWHRGMAIELYQRLLDFRPIGSTARALAAAASHLGRQRALVFVVSDFHFPLAEAAEIFDAFIHHDVVPVVAWDSAEFERLPAWGLAELQDPETGERRRLFLRPGLHAKIRERFAQRREELTHLCLQYGREPFFILDRFDPDAMTRYFYQ
jgi:uncharacterized protein (DUF58 family)